MRRFGVAVVLIPDIGFDAPVIVDRNLDSRPVELTVPVVVRALKTVQNLTVS